MLKSSGYSFFRRARLLFRRELIPFYSRRRWPYKSEKERECIRVLPSLVAHAVRYETVVGAHNTVYVQMHVAGSTVLAWYGKRRRLQYFLCSDTPGRLHSAHLVWPDSAVLQVRRV